MEGIAADECLFASVEKGEGIEIIFEVWRCTGRNWLPRSRPEHENNPDPTQQPTTNLAVTSVGGVRKKVAGVRPWLVLDSTGQTQVVEAGKHAIMRRTGLPARDLRILDPMLSYPSTILGRESAIVINLEQIKDIITAQEVLLLNSRDPSVAPFVEELKRRILCHYQATKAQEDDGDISNWKNLYDSGTPESRASSPPDFAGTGISESEEITEERKEDGKQGLENRDGPKVLPFEFVALEACLESACSCLENEVMNAAVNVETWVSASGNNGLQHDWLICIAKIGQTLTRATR
ncbi:Magnesium transporter MRS2-3 [Citrus sinensis]|uniref:Magnesium transporter MRS2-3 n=1 Tax=Citrus sinensis TaxID=2711 RepID=A0ACB8KK66_CITSI|nr:Magnesium transporter MRS2-3 [Citrus sinensis]